MNLATDQPVLRLGSDNAKRLYAYLRNNYGVNTVSGQMDTTWENSADMVAKVFKDTGKYPAIKGFDYINISAPAEWSGAGSDQTYEAMAWWNGRSGSGKATAANYTRFGKATIPEKRGIVTFCWHWRVPLAAGAASNPSTDEFYTKDASHPNGTTFVIPMNGDGTLNTRSADFVWLKGQVDLVAAQLQILKDNNVPVLWRPLHEASGGWFWWGAKRTDGINSAAAFKAMYVWMYDYLTTTKGLNNLIWVWNGQDASWYPGNAYVDIVGYDVYGTPKDTQSQISRYTSTRNMVGAAPYRIVAMSENGTMPSPESMFTDGAYWSWFLTWNDGTTAGTNNGNFWEGTFYNSAAHKTEVYNSPKVITLDKLPDLASYPF